MNTGRTPPASGRAGGIIGGYRPRPEPLRVLSLFAGIGGFDLGLERAGMRIVAQCEIDPFCRKVLAKHWPDIPCHEDIRTLRGEDVGPVDVVCGGYPCQPFSHAGKRRGAEDDRHLWPEMFRLVREIRPTWVLGENVAGHVSMGLDSVLSDLESEGYTARPFVIPACAVDAPHRRDRVWVVAHAKANRSGGDAGIAFCPEAGFSRGAQQIQSGIAAQCCSEALAHTVSTRQQGQGPSGNACHPAAHGEGKATESWDGGFHHIWSPEPGVGRVANGVSNRMDRLGTLGNAVVRQVVEQIGRAIIQAHFNHPSHVGTVHKPGLSENVEYTQ